MLRNSVKELKMEQRDLLCKGIEERDALMLYKYLVTIQPKTFWPLNKS